ncbi:MAG: M50 family metallopeptidase [Myxococcales bacterium]|nr:M50 family metallopeptidase [Myxococcales bacterium]
MGRPHPQVMLVAAALATLVLFRLPLGGLLAYPLMLVGTLAHELGHGLTGLLVGRTFNELIIRYEGSGGAHTGGPASATIGRALTCAGGLLGPTIASVGCSLLARRVVTARVGLIGAALGLGVVLLTVVHDVFTAIVVGSVAVACAVLGWWGRELARFGLSFLGVQLALQVFSRSDYLLVEQTRRGQLSDVALIATSVGGVYWMWGLAIGAISFLGLGIGLAVAWRGGSEEPG